MTDSEARIFGLELRWVDLDEWRTDLWFGQFLVATCLFMFHEGWFWIGIRIGGGSDRYGTKEEMQREALERFVSKLKQAAEDKTK